MESVEIAIVGAGVMGAATAWALSKRDVECVVLEQFAPGHDRGSSHGPTRVFRFAYEDPFYVRLAQRSLPLWRSLEEATGRTLLTPTGGVDLGVNTYDALVACGAIAERLPGTEVRSRFGFEPSSDGVYSPDTGVLAASACVASLLESSRAPIRSQRVEKLSIEEEGVVIDDSLMARRCVLTAGAWTAPLVRQLGLTPPLFVTREQVFYYRGGSDLPVVIDRGEIFRYIVPPAHGAAGTKAGEHGTGEHTTADGRSFEIDPEGQSRVSDWVANAFPMLDPAPVAAETCLYTNTPNEDFVIGSKGPVIYASPCSGHGFKFAPLIGEILASLATAKEPPVDIARFVL